MMEDNYSIDEHKIEYLMSLSQFFLIPTETIYQYIYYLS